MAGDDYKLPKLNGDNYHTWSIRARAALVQKRCWDAIEPGYGTDMTENERKKNDEALTLLFLIVEDTFLDDIGECVRARDAWNSLKDMHTKYGLLHVLQLMKDFFNVTMKPNETVKSYLGRLMEIHRKLSNGGYAFTDREVALVMLIGLPKSYEALIINLEKDEENLGTAIVKSKLLVEEKRISRNDRYETETPEERALHTKNFNLASKKQIQGKTTKKWLPKKSDEGDLSRRKATKCFSCGEWGHISRNCDEARLRSQSSAKTAIDLRTWALSANEEGVNNPDVWILDSGATEHMCSQKEKFMNLTPLKSHVQVANSEKIEVAGIGDIFLNPASECGDQTIFLANVLYVPNLDGNLLSAGRIEEIGIAISLQDGKAELKNPKENKVILTAHRYGRLYKIEEMTHKACISRHEEIMHRRLGHFHEDAVKKLVKKNNSVLNQEEASKEGTICSTCVLGKMKKLPFPKGETERSSRPLQLIHSDVAGPITPTSKGGSRYIVTFVDDYSRYVVVKTMKSKDQVLEKFIEYKNNVENLHGLKITSLRSDNGGEYVSKEFKDFLIQNGISRQLTVPRTPQQNGVAEKMNHTLFDMTRCLLLDSGIPNELWADAVTTACYLRNKCPSKAIQGNIPEELWTEKNSKTDHLKIFGCKVFSQIDKTQLKGKLGKRAQECVFVGYPEGVKGYKLWNVEEDKFFVSRNVKFNESVFPFKEKLCIPDEKTEDFIVCVHNRDIPNHINDVDPADEVTSEVSEEHNTSDDTVETLEETLENSEDTTEDKIVKVVNKNPSKAVIDTEKESRRSKRTLKTPEHLNDYVLYNVKEAIQNEKILPDEPDPVNLKEAMQSSYAEKWQEAIDEEINNLKKNQTWELVPKPPNARVIGSRWLFRRKYDEEGNVLKYKARLVAKGYSQVAGIDFNETFSPVIRIKSIRILLALAVELNYEVHQMDINAAYLNGTLNEDIYMSQPEGTAEKGKEHLVCHLKRSLYGLRQSGREWNKCLDKCLKVFGLKQSIADPCVYYDCDKEVIVGVYVDDLLIIGKRVKIQRLKEAIMKRFEAKDLGEAKHLLSMKIERKPDGSLTLDQSSYAEEILKTFEMQNAKGASTPLDPGMKYRLPADPDAKNVKVPYRQAVGSLLYLACGTRPDLSYPSTYMSQFNEHHSDEHWRGIKHMLRYLNATKDQKLTFRKTGQKLKIFSDADWGGDRVDRKSFSGYVMIMAGAAISWCSKKQNCTALSSSEAEYIAMCQSAKEFLWVKNLLKELQMDNFIGEPQCIYVDNQGAMCMAKNRETSERSKHIDLKYFFLRDLVADDILVFTYIPSKNNVADILTKSSTKRTLCELRVEMGLT